MSLAIRYIWRAARRLSALLQPHLPDTAHPLGIVFLYPRLQRHDVVDGADDIPGDGGGDGGELVWRRLDGGDDCFHQRVKPLDG